MLRPPRRRKPDRRVAASHSSAWARPLPHLRLRTRATSRHRQLDHVPHSIACRAERRAWSVERNGGDTLTFFLDQRSTVDAQRPTLYATCLLLRSSFTQISYAASRSWASLGRRRSRSMLFRPLSRDATCSRAP